MYSKQKRLFIFIFAPFVLVIVSAMLLSTSRIPSSGLQAQELKKINDALSLAVKAQSALYHEGEVIPEETSAVPMEFSEVQTVQKISKERRPQVAAVLESMEAAGGKAYIYEKADDKENLHMGFEGKEGLYDLGAIGNAGNASYGLTSVRSFELYGKPVLKFQGVFGSHVSNTGYFVIEQGIPKALLHTEGITSELDIDGDGIKEVIAELPGTIPSVNIFEWYGDSFSTANVDKVLNAVSVTFNRVDGSFTAYFKQEGAENARMAEYLYNGKAMELKKKPEN